MVMAPVVNAGENVPSQAPEAPDEEEASSQGMPDLPPVVASAIVAETLPVALSCMSAPMPPVAASCVAAAPTGTCASVPGGWGGTMYAVQGMPGGQLVQTPGGQLVQAIAQMQDPYTGALVPAGAVMLTEAGWVPVVMQGPSETAAYGPAAADRPPVANTSGAANAGASEGAAPALSADATGCPPTGSRRRASTKAIGKQGWSGAEDRHIIQYVQMHGPKWSLIAAMLPGRTDDAVRTHPPSLLACISGSARPRPPSLGQSPQAMALAPPATSPPTPTPTPTPTPPTKTTP